MPDPRRDKSDSVNPQEDPATTDPVRGAEFPKDDGRHIATDTTGAQVLTVALAYAQKGWPVFPCKPTNKAPHTPQGFKNATTNPKQIKAWWRQYPKAMIGVPMGAASGIWAIDPDAPREPGDPDGPAAWRALVEVHGIPETRTHHTPNGGSHILFRWHPERPVTNTRGGLPPGIDVRGQGGYVIVPPSVLSDNRAYHSNDCDEIAEAPDWLYDLVLGKLATASAPAEAEIAEPDELDRQMMADAEAGIGIPTPEPPPSREELQAALMVIPSDHYQTWFEVGCALYRELGEGGYDLFASWSAKSKKYNTVTCDKKWRECQKLTKYTAGTIFHYADKHDPEWRAQIIEESPIEEPTAEPSQQAPAAKPKTTVVVKSTAKPPPTMAELTHTMRDLQTRTFPQLQFVVPNYLVEGLTILGGKPKIGKSWLGLEACIAVATGGKCLGEQCEQGDVLGLFLEDSHRRLQRRMTMMLGAFTAEWPERFKYATAWPRMSQGGLSFIREWIESVENPRLIIIDILQKFRDLTKGRRQQATQYEGEYSALSMLQSITTKKPGLGILVLHHQRKQGADDPIDTLSGTLGVGGALDTFCILEKDTLGLRLYGRGRDLEEFDVSVQRDEKCRWSVLGPRVAEAPASAERAKVIKALETAGRPMSVKEIAKDIGREGENIKMLLSRMRADGDIEHSTPGSPGMYQLPKAQEEIPFPKPEDEAPF